MKKDLPTNRITNELTASSVFFPGAEPLPSPQTVPVPQQHETFTLPDVEQPKQRGTKVARNHATMPPREQARPQTEHEQDTIQAIRQTVKQIGKEAATYRLTPEEKQQLGELVYRFGQKGYRTSENEIARIAINWLLRNHQVQGAKSVLAQLLDALHR